MGILKQHPSGFFEAIFTENGKEFRTILFPEGGEEFNKYRDRGFLIEECPQAEKDAYKAQQEREVILSELSALDAPIYKIERALAGDQQAIDDIKDNEAKKNELRAKL